MYLRPFVSIYLMDKAEPIALSTAKGMLYKMAVCSSFSPLEWNPAWRIISGPYYMAVLMPINC